MALDDFNTGSSISGTTWTAVGGTVAADWPIVSGSIRPTNYMRGAYWTAITDANHYSELTFTSAQADAAGGPAVRMTSTVGVGYSATYYPNGPFVRLSRGGSGEYWTTTLGSDWSGSLTSGDVIRIEANGSSITVKRNGTTIIGPVTDTTYTTGSPGMSSIYSGTYVSWDAWGGDALGGSGSIAARAINSNSVLL